MRLKINQTGTLRHYRAVKVTCFLSIQPIRATLGASVGFLKPPLVNILVKFGNSSLFYMLPEPLSKQTKYKFVNLYFSLKNT